MKRLLPRLRTEVHADLVIVNGENSAGGRGISMRTAREIRDAGADVITTGNHVWAQPDINQVLNDDELCVIRPLNYPDPAPGKGVAQRTVRGRTVTVINAMGRVFMDALDDPFAAVERELAPQRLAGTADAIIVDVHAEATSEKMAMGHVCDGRVSLVVGSHSHVPTADHQILPKGTAYQTDAGMCGDYDSVIGMDKTLPIQRFTRKLPTERLSAAMGPGTLCAVFVETDDRTGLARRVSPVRVAGRLEPVMPAG